ncbi:hypothetical protein HDV02_006748 [Globomyces sp. JEL0801]|nr:hypothetical protein HDV02_006748 [Globomyces sp. JEL0801]
MVQITRTSSKIINPTQLIQNVFRLSPKDILLVCKSNSIQTINDQVSKDHHAVSLLQKLLILIQEKSSLVYSELKDHIRSKDSVHKKNGILLLTWLINYGLYNQYVINDLTDGSRNDKLAIVLVLRYILGNNAQLPFTNNIKSSLYLHDTLENCIPLLLRIIKFDGLTNNNGLQIHTKLTFTSYECVLRLLGMFYQSSLDWKKLTDHCQLFLKYLLLYDIPNSIRSDCINHCIQLLDTDKGKETLRIICSTMDLKKSQCSHRRFHLLIKEQINSSDSEAWKLLSIGCLMSMRPDNDLKVLFTNQDLLELLLRFLISYDVTESESLSYSVVVSILKQIDQNMFESLKPIWLSTDNLCVLFASTTVFPHTVFPALFSTLNFKSEATNESNVLIDLINYSFEQTFIVLPKLFYDVLGDQFLLHLQQFHISSSILDVSFHILKRLEPSYIITKLSKKADLIQHCSMLIKLISSPPIAEMNEEKLSGKSSDTLFSLYCSWVDQSSSETLNTITMPFLERMYEQTESVHLIKIFGVMVNKLTDPKLISVMVDFELQQMLTQPKLTEELLNSDSGSKVKDILFQRLHPLLILKMLPISAYISFCSNMENQNFVKSLSEELCNRMENEMEYKEVSQVSCQVLARLPIDQVLPIFESKLNPDNDERIVVSYVYSTCYFITSYPDLIFDSKFCSVIIPLIKVLLVQDDTIWSKVHRGCIEFLGLFLRIWTMQTTNNLQLKNTNRIVLEDILYWLQPIANKSELLGESQVLMRATHLTNSITITCKHFLSQKGSKDMLNTLSGLVLPPLIAGIQSLEFNAESSVLMAAQLQVVSTTLKLLLVIFRLESFTGFDRIDMEVIRDRVKTLTSEGDDECRALALTLIELGDF